MEATALVPMRHASERVPGKNYRTLGDRPLFAHIVDALLEARRVSRVVIDTDSELITSMAKERYGDAIGVLERPDHLRDGATPMNDVLLHDISVLDGELFLQTHSTNPLLGPSTIDDALDAFTNQDDHDSLFGVTRLQTRLFDDTGAPMNHDPSVLLRTQDLPPVFEENSNLYVFTRQSLTRTGSRLGASPMMFEIPRDQAWDIDEEIDFRVAECLWHGREQM